MLLSAFFFLKFWKPRQRKLAAPSFLWSELAQVSRSCAEKTVKVFSHGEQSSFGRHLIRVEIFLFCLI